MTRKPYNGHPSRNAWNVALWLGNDESLYSLARDLYRRHKSAARAAAAMLECLPAKTPDGVPYSRYTLRLAIADLFS